MYLLPGLKNRILAPIKPRRRIGAALAFDADVEAARANAKKAAAMVKPRAA